MNPGAKRLAALGLTCTEIVEKVAASGHQVSRMAASRWQTGKKLPAREAREALLKAFGIPVEAWDGGARAKPAPAPVVAPVPTPPPTPVPSMVPMQPPSDEPTAAELARDLLTRIQLYREQSEMTTLGVQAHRTLAEMEGKAIERYAKLTGQAATEREILSSPHFTKVLDEMFRVLEKFPDALRALRAAMSDSEAA